MREYFQGTGIVGVYKPGQVADFDDGLAQWLLDNKKAVVVEEEYTEPELGHNGETYEEVFPASEIPNLSEAVIPRRKRGKK